MPGSNDRRGELRAELPVHLWFNVLPSAEAFIRFHAAAAAVPETLGAVPELEGRDDIEQFLMHMDNKLNYIISLLAEKIGRKDYRHQGLVLDISESGLSFVSPVELSADSILEIGLVLPSQPHRTMDILGQVAWRQNQSDESSGERRDAIGIRFINILPQDEDAIVHYIFQKQREDIRRRKNGEKSVDED